jgi:hypothetical protein
MLALGALGLVGGIVDLCAGGGHALEGILFGPVWILGGLAQLWLALGTAHARPAHGGCGAPDTGADDDLILMDLLSDGRVDGRVEPRDR